MVPAHIGGAAPLPAVALSPNGDRLAAARVEGGAVSVTVADLHDPSRAARLPASVPASATRTPDSGDLMYGPGVALAFTPAGLLAVRSGRNSPAGPGSLTMWDVTDMARPRALGPPVPSDGLMSASRDGDLAIRFAGAPGRLQVVDVAAAGGPAPLGPQVPFSDRVAIPHAGLSPDGRTLAMPDGVLWDLGTPSAPRQLGTATFGADRVRVLARRSHPCRRRRPRDPLPRAERASSELQLWDVADRDLPRQLSSVTVPSEAAGSARGWWHYDDDDLGPVFAADGAVLATTDAGVVGAWDIGKLIAVRADPRLPRARWRYAGSTWSRVGPLRRWRGVRGHVRGVTCG